MVEVAWGAYTVLTPSFMCEEDCVTLLAVFSLSWAAWVTLFHRNLVSSGLVACGIILFTVVAVWLHRLFVENSQFARTGETVCFILGRLAMSEDSFLWKIT